MAGEVVREYGTNKSEQALVKRMGGKSHKNSGRGMVRKGDATWRNFVIDIKQTNKSFTMSTDAWAKICSDAAKTDITKDPALIVEFGNGVKVAIVALDVLEDLLGEEC
jgi:hypothetical protein